MNVSSDSWVGFKDPKLIHVSSNSIERKLTTSIQKHKNIEIYTTKLLPEIQTKIQTKTKKKKKR